MPRTLFFVKTPLGEFASAPQAAAAHHCDRGTILNRCITDPDNYQKIPKPPAVKAKSEWRSPSSMTWPLTWSQYRFLGYDTKEQIFLTWCKGQGLDPEAEHTADAFFDEMDMTPDPQDQDQ